MGPWNSSPGHGVRDAATSVAWFAQPVEMASVVKDP